MKFTEYKTRLKLFCFCTDNSCEKGRLLERVGRKALGLIMMGSGIAHKMDELNNATHSFVRTITFQECDIGI